MKVVRRVKYISKYGFLYESTDKLRVEKLLSISVSARESRQCRLGDAIDTVCIIAICPTCFDFDGRSRPRNLWMTLERFHGLLHRYNWIRGNLHCRFVRAFIVRWFIRGVSVLEYCLEEVDGWPSILVLSHVLQHEEHKAFPWEATIGMKYQQLHFSRPQHMRVGGPSMYSLQPSSRGKGNRERKPQNIFPQGKDLNLSQSRYPLNNFCKRLLR